MESLVFFFFELSAQLLPSKSIHLQPKSVLERSMVIIMTRMISMILINIQGDPKKMSVSVFDLKSVLDVGFDFSACVLESEF